MNQQRYLVKLFVEPANFAEVMEAAIILLSSKSLFSHGVMISYRRDEKVLVCEKVTEDVLETVRESLLEVAKHHIAAPVHCLTVHDCPPTLRI